MHWSQKKHRSKNPVGVKIQVCRGHSRLSYPAITASTCQGKAKPAQHWNASCRIHSPVLELVSIGYIVVGRRVFDIAGGRPTMYIVVYIHRVYKWYIRYVCSIYGGPPAKTKSQTWRPPTTMIGYTRQKLLMNWAISVVRQSVCLQVFSCLCTTGLSLFSGIAHLPFGIVLANIFLLCSFRGASNLCSGLKTC